MRMLTRETAASNNKQQLIWMIDTTMPHTPRRMKNYCADFPSTCTKPIFAASRKIPRWKIVCSSECAGHGTASVIVLSKTSKSRTCQAALAHYRE
jgi:hypothetical protein